MTNGGDAALRRRRQRRLTQAAYNTVHRSLNGGRLPGCSFDHFMYMFLLSFSASNLVKPFSRLAMAAAVAAAASLFCHAEGDVPVQWEHCGWGGGGYYFGVAFHPAKDGEMFLGGNVIGFYKSEDHGRTWKFSNKGLRDYVIHSLAADPVNPGTLYASTVGGLYKSTDSGATWQFIKGTGKDGIRLTGERDLSIQPVAVNPADGKIVYAGSPGGSVYKSEDGALTWREVYRPAHGESSAEGLRIQFGRARGGSFGGVWKIFDFPANLSPSGARGITIRFKPETPAPSKLFFVTITTKEGYRYESRSLAADFQPGDWKDVSLGSEDFKLSEAFKRDQPDQAAAAPAEPHWPSVMRMDLVASGDLPKDAHVLHLKSISFVTGSGPADRVPAIEFAPDSPMQTYGNARVGAPVPGTVYSVVVARKAPDHVAAATAGGGVVLSEDDGRSWKALPTPSNATSVVFDPADPSILYGTFATDGVWKSEDGGRSWKKISDATFIEGLSARQVAVNPADSNLVYVIGSKGWGGAVYRSEDAGKTWTRYDTMKAEPGNPTVTTSHGWAETVPMSTLTNIAINPLNPRQIFVSANWRPCLSEDGGLTWTECDRGADITVLTDIRFSGSRAYVTAMDEGTFTSGDGGKTWKQLWPSKYADNVTGHSWRIAVNEINGADRVIGTQAPWNARHPNRVIVSEDGGATQTVVTEGLPDYIPRKNTMWGQGYGRALAVDPNDPKIVWLGIDGDAEPGRSGGGVFRSTDGGCSWGQLPNQPGSRRMFYGLAVDPTDSRRIFWGACGTNGGVWLSEDAGGTWKNVFNKDSWIFNLLAAPSGDIYAGGKQLYRSQDHGKTWASLTSFPPGLCVVGIEVHPSNPGVIWCSAVSWGSTATGGVYKSVDGGATWSEITGNLPYVKPLILRFNPATGELWCGSPALFKTPQ